MPMLRLRELEPVDASVPRTATFGEAAEALAASGLSAVAVLDERGHVAGLFTEDDFLAGIFPRYLGELRHTAFVPDDLESATERARAVAGEPVERHMRKAVTVEADTSAIHAAEVFLHCEWGAVALVDADERYVGMLSQVEFCRRLLPTLGR
jgi:CBS-domain-containing membrane protein